MLRRNTNQKQIVYESLKFLGHATMDELINYINENYENISLATIYRNLGIMLEDEQIKKVKLDNCEVYETVKGKHYHFVCKHCGKIIDVSPNEINTFDNNSYIGNNRIEDCEITYYGTCKNCLNKILN